METQIAQLASSSTTWQTEYSLSPSLQVEDEISSIILARDEECDSFLIRVDDVPIDKEGDHLTTNEIDDVPVIDHVNDVKVYEKSNINKVFMSLPSYVPKISLPGRMDDTTKVDQWFDIDKFSITLTTLVLENTCFKVDAISRIVQHDHLQNSVSELFLKAPTLYFSKDGDSKFDSLFIDVRSQEIQLTPAKVRSSKKPPLEPPYENVKGVRPLRGSEFYR